MGIHFSNKPNFGNLGAEGDPVDVMPSEMPDGGSQTGDTASAAGGAGDKAKAGGGELSSLVRAVAGGPAGGSMCGACGSANQQAKNNQKAAMAQKYPILTCLPGDSACEAYNAKQLGMQQAGYDSWYKSYTTQVSAQMSPQDKQRLAAVAQLAQQMKKLHPDTANMTLSQAAAAYPADFQAAYAQVQTQYPFLQGIDYKTALAMSPAIANQTLDSIISDATAMSSGLSGVSNMLSNVSGATWLFIGGGLTVAGIIAWVLGGEE